MEIRRALAWSLLLAGAATVASSQQAPPPRTPAPVPPMALPPAPPTGPGGGTEGTTGKPSVPVTPLDPSTLTEEERAYLATFFKGQLPADATFDEMLRFVLEPQPYPKSSVVRMGDGFASPHKALPWKMEIVKEDETNVWLRHLPPEDPASMLHKLWVAREQREQLSAVQNVIAERDKPYFLDFEAPIVPPPFARSLSFLPVESELPKKGKWQMGFALADMNGDKVTDIVLPPERLGLAFPAIFLGDGGGRFRYWREARWTQQVPWDYGGIAVADLDQDGNQDVVLAIHFKGQYVVYGDGKGQFARATMLPSPDPRVTSRASAVADFDGDGRLDLAFLAEISYDQAQASYLPKATTAWVLLNRGNDRWELVKEGMPGQVIGDNLAATDLDGDRRPDLVLGAGTSNWRSLAWLNTAAGWKESFGKGVLSNAWHFQVLADPKRAAGGGQELYAAFEQFKMVSAHNEVRTGLIRYRWGAEGISEPGQPLVVDDRGTDQYWRLALGDLNGDGRTDIVAGRKGGGLEVFLQSASGDLVKEQAPELEGRGRPFNIQLVDLDGDKRDDIVASFANRDKLPGGVYVWLTKPGA